jgi:hypothetical protein
MMATWNRTRLTAGGSMGFGRDREGRFSERLFAMEVSARKYSSMIPLMQRRDDMEQEVFPR